MSSGSIARRYARALMGIGVDNGNYETIGEQVGALARAMKISSELAQTLSNPAFPRSDRKKVLGALLDRLGALPMVKNFTLLLLDRDRLSALPGIARELQVMIDEQAGRVNAVVTSARPLTDNQLEQIKSQLEKLSGKTVQIEHKEDPGILGGVIAKVGDLVYDGSLRTQLSQMRDRLTS